MRRLAFDLERLRPGCALVQAAMGGDHGIASLFDADTWLLAPTDTMRVYRLTDRQLADLVPFVNSREVS